MKKNQNLLNVLENVLTEVLDDLWTAYSNLTEDSSMGRRVQVGKDISEISTGLFNIQMMGGIGTGFDTSLLEEGGV